MGNKSELSHQLEINKTEVSQRLVGSFYAQDN